MFQNTAPDDLRNSYSLAWNLQVDPQLNQHWLLRAGCEERSTCREFVLEPVVNGATTNEGLLLLENSGRSRYREFQTSARFRFQESRNIYLSYVRKGLSIPFRGKKYKGRAGFTVFNITNHWNPRDVQNNLDAQQFGTFFNSAGRSVRLKFEFVKY